MIRAHLAGAAALLCLYAAAAILVLTGMGYGW